MGSNRIHAINEFFATLMQGPGNLKNSMQIFKIRQDGIKDIKKQAVIRTLPVILIAVTVGIVISSINSKDNAADKNVLPVVIPLIALAVGFGMYRGVNRQ